MGYPRSTLGTPGGFSSQLNGGFFTDRPFWLLVTSDFSPGTSGGPAISSSGVFATVTGRAERDGKIKFLVPITMAYPLLTQYANMKTPGANRRVPLTIPVGGPMSIQCDTVSENRLNVIKLDSLRQQILSAKPFASEALNVSAIDLKAHVEDTRVFVSWKIIGPSADADGQCASPGKVTLSVAIVLADSADAEVGVTMPLGTNGTAVSLGSHAQRQ
jgi:hypothetical protein